MTPLCARSGGKAEEARALFIYLRERGCVSEGGGDVEDEGENPKQTAPLTVEPVVGLDLTTLRPESKPRVGCSTDWSHPGIPKEVNFRRTLAEAQIFVFSD